MAYGGFTVYARTASTRMRATRCRHCNAARDYIFIVASVARPTRNVAPKICRVATSATPAPCACATGMPRRAANVRRSMFTRMSMNATTRRRLRAAAPRLYTPRRREAQRRAHRLRAFIAARFTMPPRRTRAFYARPPVDASPSAAAAAEVQRRGAKMSTPVTPPRERQPPAR